MGDYRIDLTNEIGISDIQDFNFKGENPKGDTLGINNKFFTKNNKPWYPIMGEFHFSRYPEHYWEESILKMKAGGVDIIATYVFWIHHEEIEGQYDWTGSRNLKKFIELCSKCGIYVLLRIGPWAHGECRNGGFPDWLIHRNDFKARTNNTKYFEYVKLFYKNIFEQVNGQLFKDGGPIIGIQLENEFGHAGGLRGEDGKKHIIVLKKLALEVGFKVPYYTTTGWGGGIVVEGETLPVLGAYADAPWANHIKELPKSEEFIFSSPKAETNIATDLKVGMNSSFSYDITKYPYFTAELGGGIQVTQHRRPIVGADDTEAMAFTKLGSEANLLGYYMYHGGTNPEGKLSTLQESKATGYSNDLPELSYDFQAPIREYGQISDTYRYLKVLHMFLKDFEHDIANTVAYIPKWSAQEPTDTESLRISVRHNESFGFVFINNHQRHLSLSNKEIDLFIKTEYGEIGFPKLNMLDGMRKIMPFNMDLQRVKLIATQAQPLCKLNNKDFIFFAYENEKTQYVLENKNIKTIEVKNASLEYIEDNSKLVISGGLPIINIVLDSGESVTIHTITRQHAEQAWKVKIKGSDVLMITSADVIYDSDSIKFCTRQEKSDILTLPAVNALSGLTYNGTDQVLGFDLYHISFEKNNTGVVYKLLETLSDGTKVYDIKLNAQLSDNVEDLFLGIDFYGDSAKLFIDNKFVADWFYTGLTWDIGLKRFKDKIRSNIKLEIKPLHKEDYVYVEKQPEYEEDTACKINFIKLESEYFKVIKGLENN